MIRRVMGSRAIAAVRLATMTFCVFLVGCNPGTPLTADGVTLLRWGHLDARPGGLGSGPLTFRGGCVGVEAPSGERVVVLWPPTSQFDRSTGILRVVIDGVAFGEGDALRFGGGEYTDQAWVASLVGPVPAACQADRYLLATELVTE